jgi:hypothetical protein
MGRPAYAGSLDSKSHQNGSIFPNKLTYATVSVFKIQLKKSLEKVQGLNELLYGKSGI